MQIVTSDQITVRWCKVIEKAVEFYRRRVGRGMEILAMLELFHQ
jgi:hypothetical protein